MSESSGGRPAPRRFTTGNVFLDRRVGGGVPVGNLLAVVAPPESQSQLLLREFAATRESVYICTTCSDETEIREQYLPAGASSTVLPTSPESMLASPGEYAAEVPAESFVFVDAVNGLEHAGDRSAYLGFLNALKKRLREVGAVGVLHALESDPSPRMRTETLHRADHVWRLKPEFGSRNIRYRLLVTKARGHGALDAPIPLVLTDRVEIDTSWTI